MCIFKLLYVCVYVAQTELCMLWYEGLSRFAEVQNNKFSEENKN